MADSDDLLVLAPEVTVRPMAEGCVLIVGDDAPRILDPLREQIVTVCTRPAARTELIEAVVEVGGVDPTDVATAIDELIEAGALTGA